MSDSFVRPIGTEVDIEHKEGGKRQIYHYRVTGHEPTPGGGLREVLQLLSVKTVAAEPGPTVRKWTDSLLRGSKGHGTENA